MLRLHCFFCESFYNNNELKNYFTIIFPWYIPIVQQTTLYEPFFMFVNLYTMGCPLMIVYTLLSSPGIVCVTMHHFPFSVGVTTNS